MTYRTSLLHVCVYGDVCCIAGSEIKALGNSPVAFFKVGSVAGAISSKARNRLLPEKVAKLTFTKMNWHHVGHKSFRDREKATALAEKAIEAAEQAIAAAAAASVPAAWTASAQNNCK